MANWLNIGSGLLAFVLSLAYYLFLYPATMAVISLMPSPLDWFFSIGLIVMMFVCGIIYPIGAVLTDDFAIF